MGGLSLENYLTPSPLYSHEIPSQYASPPPGDYLGQSMRIGTLSHQQNISHQQVWGGKVSKRNRFESLIRRHTHTPPFPFSKEIPQDHVPLFLGNLRTQIYTSTKVTLASAQIYCSPTRLFPHGNLTPSCLSLFSQSSRIEAHHVPLFSLFCFAFFLPPSYCV